MEHTRFIKFIVLGILLALEVECQELVTLNVPSIAPFVFHPTEELSMDISEMHPVFLYASSQNDYIHQNLPEHAVISNLPRTQQFQANLPRHKFPNPRPTAAHNQKNNHRNGPPLTYGFQPKPSSNRQDNHHHRLKKFHSNHRKNPHNHRSVSRHAEASVFQPASRVEHQHQNSKFSQNIQIQSGVQHNRHNTNGLSSSNSQNGHADFNQAFNYRPQQFVHREKKYNSPSSEHRGSNRNNERNENTRNREENRTPLNIHHEHQNMHNGEEIAPVHIHHDNRNYQTREENRQESVRKHISFEDTVQAFKNRNIPNNGNNFPQKTSNSFNGQSLPERNTPNGGNNNFPQKTSNSFNGQSSPERNRNNNERLNLQPQARSMRGENKPQLPPRPPFNNGAVKINTIAGELPIINFDSISTINDNPTFLQNTDHHYHASTDEQEKKTYLLIKAPTPESPTAAPFIIENLQHTPVPYVLNNLPETTVHIPELFSTSAEPHILPENVPEIVLDLVQIPDHAVFNHQETHGMESLPRSEFRSTATKEHDHIEKFRPTENYPTTPLHSYRDVIFDTNAYSPVAEDSIKHQSKLIPRPKIKESKKPLNDSLQPISYSSSVSVVSVKQNIDSKPQAPKKQKTTLKKALSRKKKTKVPENEDFGNDDHYGSQDIPGEAGADYPIYKDIPKTSFDCRSMKSPGFYADLDAGCQVFHNCDTGMVKHSFVCPNGTIFHQELFICDWWYNVKCDDSPEFYSLNSGLYVTNNSNDDSEKKA